ncbi:hypothetical protein [Xenococcus sp. PCC 7305]|nr:hypothetical protein [Xenococcus sp. PCC 7305]
MNSEEVPLQNSGFSLTTGYPTLFQIDNHHQQLQHATGNYPK